ncbi:pentalenene synthase [Kitasatospora sp. NPDC101183]|uniref:terpene synthase family protein n=1 Tax=Kitasatospora sp. NPDC101183 TaxID=3364100 RepID=UPI0038254CB7
MPQDIDFALPWDLRVSPHLAAAREHNVDWMIAGGLLAPEALPQYLGWQLAEVAAYFYPEASEEGLFLAADLMGWYFTPFDDQFDGALGARPQAVAEILSRFVAELHTGSGLDHPAISAFADIWQRYCRGMSPNWTARTAANWCQYLAVYLTESQIRTGQVAPGGVEAHLWRRRRSTSAYVVNDLCERVSGFEVPALAWYSQALNDLRDTAADIVSISNDVASVEKEAGGQTGHSNLLLLLEHDLGMTRQESLAEAVERTQGLVRRFTALEEEALSVGRCLPEGGEESVRRYVLMLRDSMVGNDHWERTSSRYAAAPAQHPAPGPALDLRRLATRTRPRPDATR